MFKNILGNSILTALIRGASFGVRIFALLISARYSEPAYFGTIALFFTVAEIGRLVADFGVDTYTMREYASHRNKQMLERTIGSAICVKITFGILVSCLGLGVMWYLRSDNFLLMLPFALMIISPLIMNLPINFFIAKMRGRHIVFFVLAAGLMSLVIFYLIFAVIKKPQAAFFIIPIIESIVGLVLICKVPVIRRSLHSLHFDGMVELIKMTLPIAVATILGIAYGRMDVFFLEKFRSAEELGLYAFSVRLVEPFQFIAGALAVNAYGHIASSLKKSAIESANMNSRYRKVMAIYAAIAFVLILIIANIFLGSLFAKYAVTQWMLNIAGIILIFKCGNLITTSGIQAHGKYKFITSIAIWNFSFLIIAMFILVPRMGAYGALISVLTMEATNFLLQNYYLRKLLVEKS
ncbi:oligosaccharide flippase family protein [Collimonas sp. NPDC087041]|uniref:oligosaccharide flippase family protein n=1 Tax=Collimonas sp. NPDC087041 TaxID=3363960 RepID=UPI0038011AE7